MATMKPAARGEMTFWRYTAAYAALLLLSALTFGLSFAHLKSSEWFVALGIAVIKSTIVAWYFMHLVEMSNVHRLSGVVAASLLAVLILLAMADAWTRPQIKMSSNSVTESLSRQGAATDRLPPSLNDVGVEEHLGVGLPLQLAFVDERGRAVHLSDVIDGKLPVILTLNYSNCPMLCSLELSGLARTLKHLELRLGQSYRVLTVSLDPEERPETARRTQARYLEQAGSPASSSGWSFLTGTEPNIRALASAIGFKYRYDAHQRQYSHAAAIAIVSPTGQVTRYFYGIEYDASTTKLALVEASQGRVGSTVDKLILFCSVYDPRRGSYGVVAGRIMRLGGVLVLAILAVFLVFLWRREPKRVQSAST